MSSSTSSPNQNILLTPSSNLIKNGQILNPDKLPRPIIFLSGTTNYNKDETRWQQTLANALFAPSPTTSTSTSNNTHNPSPFTIIDPYNPAWDSTWREATSDEKFVAQVNFEIQALELADIVVVGFIGADIRAGKIGAGGDGVGGAWDSVEEGGDQSACLYRRGVLERGVCESFVWEVWG